MWEFQTVKSDLGHSRSLILVTFDGPHDFLLVFHCNYVTVVTIVSTAFSALTLLVRHQEEHLAF